jgi:crotonobetainyl-CoA:carnitine CoA-transferase CaiB-like acyl-CoA transferase
VIDLTQIVAGPVCTRILADLGADVVKIEPPTAPHAELPRRSVGPIGQNVGKRSIVVDLKTAEGVEVARELATGADVLVQNYRPGALAELGLGYPQLSAANPRLIYTTIAGFGQNTSQWARGAFGATAHAEAGWLWVQQMAQAGASPFPPGVTIADLATGMNAAMAILAALYDREQTGTGQAIDISLMDSQLALLTEPASQALSNDPGAAWAPFRHGLQRTRDGHVTVNAGPPRNWRRIARAIGRPEHELLTRDAVESELEAWAAGLTTAEVARALGAADVPYGVVRSIHEALDDPYFAERGMIAEVPDTELGSIRTVASPLFFSNASSRPAGPSPMAGEHTAELLGELGYDEAAIARLIATGVVEIPEERKRQAENE